MNPEAMEELAPNCPCLGLGAPSKASYMCDHRDVFKSLFNNRQGETGFEDLLNEWFVVGICVFGEQRC